MTRVGRYEVQQEIGRGGMAAALLAVAEHGQRVVLKVPTHRSAEADERLRNEARIGIRLDHEGLVQTLDLFEHQGRPVLVVAFIDGRSLVDVLAEGALPAPAVFTLGLHMAGALKAIHRCTDEGGRPLRMLHRDVTPGNILISREGAPKLIDLGIARSAEALLRTRTGTLLGTLPYLAPELFDQPDYTTATDLWALGCVLFEAATGERLYAGTEAQIVRKLLTQRAADHPRWGSLEPALRDVLELLLDKDPRQRLADAEKLEQLMVDRYTRFPGGPRQLAERVGARSGDFDEGTEVALPPTPSAYFPEDHQLEVDKHRLSTTRQWESKATPKEHRPQPVTMRQAFATDDLPLFPLPPPTAAQTMDGMTTAELPGIVPAQAQQVRASPHASANAPSADLLDGPAPQFAPLPMGAELTAPDPSEVPRGAAGSVGNPEAEQFVSIDELRLVPGTLVDDGTTSSTSAQLELDRPPKPAIAGAPAEDPFAPPPAPPPVELDVDAYGARGKRTFDAAHASSEAFYPQAPAARSTPTVAILLATVGVLALLVAGVALRVDRMVGVDLVGLFNSAVGREPKRVDRDAPGTVRVHSPPVLDGIEDLPDCWVGDEGWSFVFTNEVGTQEHRNHIGDVPRHYRRRARCVDIGFD